MMLDARSSMKANLFLSSIASASRLHRIGTSCSY
jgi:hypothetical protein